MSGPTANVTPEQQARDLLDRMGVEGAQDFSSGEVVELANLIAEVHEYRKADPSQTLRVKCPKCEFEGGSYTEVSLHLDNEHRTPSG